MGNSNGKDPTGISGGIIETGGDIAGALDDADNVLPTIPGIDPDPLCKSKRNPDYSNICSNALGETTNSSGFCSPSGSGGDKYRKEYCVNLGGSGEFTYAGGGPGCNYNPETNKSIMEGCCGSLCGISGTSAKCRRDKFNADPFLCCNRDLACNENPDNCFKDSERKETCAPEFRDMASLPCKKLMVDYCLGRDLPSSDTQTWITRWTSPKSIQGQTFGEPGKGPCYNSIYRNLYDGQRVACVKTIQKGIPTAQGIIYGRDLMTKMIEKYLSEGGDLVATESSETNTQLNDIIWEICSTTPSLCTPALTSYCNNVTDDTLRRMPQLSKWCGCYMTPEVYSKYTGLYGISRECTPTCNMQGNIGLSTDDGTGIKRCGQNICLIDDINITIAKSQTGNINIGQLCNSCSIDGNSGTCNCSITGGNFTIVNSETGNLNLTQQCSAESSCYQEQEINGEIKSIKVPCSGTEGELNPYLEAARISEENFKKAVLIRNIIIIVIFIVLLVIIILVWYFVKPDQVPKSKNTQIKQTVPPSSKISSINTPLKSQNSVFR